MKFETKTIHAGIRPDPSTGAIMTPIFQTSTYVQESPGVHKGYDYSRTGNPTRKVLEDNLAAIEGGKFGIAFSSGVGAASTLMHLFGHGDHIVCSDDVYGGTYRLFTKVLNNCGMTFSFVDMTDFKNVEKAITSRTKLIWLESPSNPLLKIIDMKPLCDFAKSKNIMTVVDNTFMSPYFQNPLKLGADVVLHSTTKYLNGHSDVIGGVLITNNDAIAEKLYFLQKSLGAVPSPFDCFLVLRGVKTLHVRMKEHQTNAMSIAHFLQSHKNVEKVIYPGLSSHPQHDIAKRQMSGYGGMVSFVIKGGLESSRRLLENLKLFSLAESLGGVESLIEHPAIMTHASIPKEIREKSGIVDGFIRISVGIESSEDLIDDLEQALKV